MGRTVVFNGVELVIPDAYSALDVSRLLQPSSGGAGIVALVGESDGGAPGLHLFPGGSTPTQVKRELKSGDGANAVRLALRGGTDPLVQGGASSVLFAKTNQSTQSTLDGSEQEIWDTDFTGLTGDSFDVNGVGLKVQGPGDTFFAWFLVTDGDFVQTAPTGNGTAVQVSVLEADTAAQLATKFAAAVNALAAIASSAVGAVATTTHDAGGYTPNASASTSGTTVTTSQEGSTPDFVLRTKQYGLHTSLYTASLASVSGGKVLTVRDENDVPDISPVVGVTEYLSVLYNGDATTAVALLEYVSGVLRLKTTLAGDQTDGSVDLDIDTTGLTIGQLVSQINLNTGYVATLKFPNGQFLVSDLDLVTGTPVSILAELDFKASLKELEDWGEAQSPLVTIERSAGNFGRSVPASLLTSQFSGGTRGTSTNTNFQAMFDLLLQSRVNIAAPLLSEDNQNGSTATLVSVNSQLKDHVTNRSSILGRSEAQGYVAIKGNKDAFKAEAARMNSRRVAVTSQRITDLDIDGEVVEFKEFMTSVVAAQTQAGSPIGTPLTNRILPISGFAQDVSWNPVEDSAELIKAGCMLIYADERNVIRFRNGYQSWLGDTNNANIFIETVESLDHFSFNHRLYMKERFLGISNFNATDVVNAIIQSQKFEKDVNKTIKGYDTKNIKIYEIGAGKLVYDVPVEPFEGIVFILPTVVAIRE